MVFYPEREGVCDKDEVFCGLGGRFGEAGTGMGDAAFYYQRRTLIVRRTF